MFPFNSANYCLVSVASFFFPWSPSLSHVTSSIENPIDFYSYQNIYFDYHQSFFPFPFLVSTAVAKKIS